MTRRNLFRPGRGPGGAFQVSPRATLPAPPPPLRLPLQWIPPPAVSPAGTISEYSPAAILTSPSDAGTLYNMVLEATLADGVLRRYGYMIVAEGYGPGQKGGWTEATDLHAKDELTYYSSPNVIDRDLVNMPRVTQGDWTGGMLQETFTDPARYWDSDLDVNTAGYLTLRPKWVRQSTATAVTPAVNTPLAVPVGGTSQDFIFFTAGAPSAGQGITTIWALGANGRLTSITSPINIMDMDTDGTNAYISGGSTIQQLDGTFFSFTQVAASLANGVTAFFIWVIKLGTAGYFLYFVGGSAGAINQLYRLSLSPLGFPVPTSAQALVPLGGINDSIVDICSYQTGIAILTRDGATAAAFNVWYHDGTNMNLIVHVSGATAAGMCNSLGDLYVSSYVSTSFEPVQLIKVSPSGFQVVAKLGLPGLSATAQSCLQPRASGRYVYWPIYQPTIAGISGGPYVAVYNTITGSLSHFGSIDLGDFQFTGTAWASPPPRSFAPLGSSIFVPQITASNTLGIQSTQNSPLTSRSIAYQASGRMVSSRFDFNTPSIQKMFRRVTVYHAPLPSNCTLRCDVFVDGDPSGFYSGLIAPQPSGINIMSPDHLTFVGSYITDAGLIVGTAVNSTIASTATVVTLPQSTLGYAVYYVLTLSTSDGLNTPVVNYVSIEANVLWTWKMKLDCSSQVLLLNGRADTQGVTAKDRYFFLHEAYEQGATFKLYHPSGEIYTVEGESITFWSKNPRDVSQSLTRADYEAYADVTLRATHHG